MIEEWIPGAYCLPAFVEGNDLDRDPSVAPLRSVIPALVCYKELTNRLVCVTVVGGH